MGDLIRGLTVLDFFPDAPVKLALQSQTAQALWLSSVLPMNEGQAMVFDRYRNVMVLERPVVAVNDQMRRRVEIVAGIRWNEEVTRAVSGRFQGEKEGNEEKEEREERKERGYLKKE